MSTTITVAKGDGIGPEIMDATLRILDAAGADLSYDVIEVGEKVYLSGEKSGIPESAWESLAKSRILLKAPITTPSGGGYKSLNVTLRKTLSMFANVRPVKAYSPYVQTPYPLLDMVIVRENEEDLYAGIEHQQTDEVVQTLKLISRPGCERIVRYAFEYARAYGRKKVTAMAKDNIMKQADGLFHRVFDEIATEYPDIENEYKIIDIGSALVAARPERLDVIVTLNLYGDIISDIAAEVAGSVGMGGSANVGSDYAMFEAIHGSAPDIAGQGIANPSGLLGGAVMMLVHLGKPDVAAKVRNGWLRTIEDGIHTGDIFRPQVSTQKVGTQEFADAVIERLGQEPAKHLSPESFGEPKTFDLSVRPRERKTKQLVGVDVFCDWHDGDRNDANVIGRRLDEASTDTLRLKLITNRGVLVYPEGNDATWRTDHWRCRFTSPNGAAIAFDDVLELLRSLDSAGLDVIKTEHLYTFDGQRGYSLAQGE
jgi:isocitrate dehydrogenase